MRVNGTTYTVVGRIAMDQMVIDLGLGARADAGSGVDAGSNTGAAFGAGPLLGATAVLFGNGADGGPLVEQWADAAGTINYEVVTRISQRVPRSYIGGAP